MADDEHIPFTLFPQGTLINISGDEVMFKFADVGDAIVFYEFIGSFVKGEIELYAVSK